MLNITIVHTGDKYPLAYSAVLKRMLDRHVSVPFRFCVFSDRVADLAPLLPTAFFYDVHQFGLDGWWNKMLLFNWEWHGMTDQILYYDLDMVLTGPQDLFTDYRGSFAACEMFRHPMKMGSTLMSITPDWGQDIWDRFCVFGAEGYRGDQEYLEAVVGGTGDRWQEMSPGCVMSYKNHIRRKLLRPTSECRVVSFHGKPDPHDLVDVPWVRKMWQ